MYKTTKSIMEKATFENVTIKLEDHIIENEVYKNINLYPIAIIGGTFNESRVISIKTPQEVDDICEILQRFKEQLWPTPEK
jgi:hypothetical protein